MKEEKIIDIKKCWICGRKEKGFKKYLYKDAKDEKFKNMEFVEDGITNIEVIVCPICMKIMYGASTTIFDDSIKEIEVESQLVGW